MQVLPDQSLANRLVAKPRCDQGNEVCGARVERESRLFIEPRNIVELWSLDNRVNGKADGLYVLESSGLSNVMASYCDTTGV